MAATDKKHFQILSLVLALTAPSAMAATVAPAGQTQNLKLFVYGADGRLMNLNQFLSFTGRADPSRLPGQNGPAIMAYAIDGTSGQKPTLTQSGRWINMQWQGQSRISIALAWPIAGDGFSTVQADSNGAGYGDGDAVYLNEDIASTQYHLFKDAWLRHTDSMRPVYQPSAKVVDLSKKAEDLVFKAKAAKSGAARAAAADLALQTTALAWERMLFEHGIQIARDPAHKTDLRFGVTLDSTILNRLPDYRNVIKSLKDAGVNWVRLVFTPNASDFTYSMTESYDSYDAVVQALNRNNIKIMGCVLDSAGWLPSLTPQLYAKRAKLLAIHYEGRISSWEVGNEINGDWLGGLKTPLSTDQAFEISQAAADEIKNIDPHLETVATLYWWGPTAPDYDHSLQGWLSRYVPEGFGQNIDVVALSLEPEDNPVGIAFESLFQKTAAVFPDKKLMVGDFEYGESGKQQGYWWLKPGDLAASREDLVSLYTPASCAAPQSVCGGFFWYTLEQMLPPGAKPSRLFRAYSESLRELGR